MCVENNYYFVSVSGVNVVILMANLGLGIQYEGNCHLVQN